MCLFAEPSWASVNRGVFMCNECAGVHCSLGRHVSQVNLSDITISQWFSTGVLSELFRGSASCLWKMNFVCVYQKQDPILKSCARNIKLKFLIEFFTRINVIFYSLY